MRQVVTIGLDIAKDVFQAFGADVEGNQIFNRKLTRSEVLPFFERMPQCKVGMEACSSSHHWARHLSRLGHDVRLLHPAYVRPFVKRDKTDANDAEAINEALLSKRMWFVPVKTVEQQATIMLFRTRAMFIRQRVKAVNALRSHFAELGFVAARGRANLKALKALMESESGRKLPHGAKFALNLIREQLDYINLQIEKIEGEIQAQVKEDEELKRLTTVPGVGPIISVAVRAFVTDASSFKSARHFASWVGLTPRSHSSGGKEFLGHMSKRGNRQLRALLIIGAMSVLRQAKDSQSWICRLRKRRPFKVAAVALANKISRILWALMVKGGTYHSSGITGAV